MTRTATVRALAVVGLLLLVTGSPTQGKKKKNKVTSKDQISFGVQMAQRGLWSEALFRFEQAERLEPENPRVLNNLAVANEALGRFDEALAYYQKALRLDPANKEMKRNYSRFVEFYQSFKPQGETAEGGGEGEGSDPQNSNADSP